YGATAGVSVVQLYAGAFFPGFMLAGLYIGYVIILAKWNPAWMPPLPESERKIALPDFAQRLSQGGTNALAGLFRAARCSVVGVAKGTVWGQLLISLLPAFALAAIVAVTFQAATAPVVEESTAGLQEAGGAGTLSDDDPTASTRLDTPGGVAEPPPEGASPPPPAAPARPAPPAQQAGAETPAAPLAAAQAQDRLPTPWWFWVVFGICAAIAAVTYFLWSWERFEVFKFLLASFFPLAILILAVLGSIVFGLATPTEAAAVGALGGLILAAAYRLIQHWRAAASGAKGPAVRQTVVELGGIIKESSFLTAQTTAMW